MENKKTTELLDLLYEKTKDGEWDDECNEIREELENREPFYSWIHDNNGVLLKESLEQTDENVKLLKRHKHDNKSGDVLVRI